MKEWEYCQRSVRYGTEVQDECNEMAEEGWEAISVFPNINTWWVLFRRKLNG